MPSLVLVVEDEQILAESVCIYLGRHGYATARAESGEAALRLVDENSPDVALVDLRLPGIDGLEVLRRVREVSPGTEVIMMTAHGSVISAVEAMKRGAFDYLNKPVDLDELRVLIEKAVAHLRLRRELNYLKSKSDAGRRVSSILGESPAISALREQVRHIVTLESVEGTGGPTVLLLGETGTGKGLVAHAIHHQGARAAGPFVEINCAAIPSALLESELFGYERGAYTDARTAKPGLFEAADGGTLFLDEIGSMDPALQVKLLKVIEDKSVRRLGGLRPKLINARLVAATNCDLEAAVAEGAFRQDLYYRIKVLTIEIPPLRERGEDILLLARHFLDTFARQYGRPRKRLTETAETALRTYSWPGNVRELAHVMERAAIVHAGAAIAAEELGIAPVKPPGPVTVNPDGGVQVDFAAGGIVLEDVERQLIARALEAAGWNRGAAAQLLGVSRDTLRYRLEKYKLHPPGE